ncbi:MAG TPA: hypothetical protein DCM68_07985, partial [Verrucomicrobia bacterium]|nr:hypothetical protein [Verrucomicrobiota bacterium]
MNCQFKASIYPPLPDKDAPDYSDKCREWEKNPRLLVELEIAFPRYYWRAKYFQEGKEPFFITDCPVKGNAVQLKDCAFLNNVDLKLPGGAVIRGFPHDDMPAELIRKHTAILEQEGLFAREDSEIKAEIARMRRDLEEGVDRIAKAAHDATLPPGKRKWWQNLWASFKTCPDSMKEGEKWEAVARKVLTGVWENASNL